MELFTLGADRGRVHRERRARAGPGAHRLALRLELAARRAQLPLSSPSRHDPGSKTIFGQTGAFDLGGGGVGCACVNPLHRVVLRARSCGATSSRPRRPPPSAARSSRPTWRAATRCARCSRRSSSTRSSTPARGWSSRPWCSWPGMLRALRRAIDAEDWWWLCRDRRPAAVPPARRGRLGPRALARLQHRARPLGDRGRSCSAAATSRVRRLQRLRRRPRPPQQAVAKALAFWGNPDMTSEAVGRAHHLRRRLRATPACPAGSSSSTARAAPERAPPAHLLLPRPSGVHDAQHVQLQRLVPRPPAAQRRRAGRPGAPGDRARACPCRPAPACLGARFVSRGRRAGLRRLRRREPGSQGVRGGHRRGGRRRAGRARARVGVPLRRRRLDDRARAHRRPALRDAPAHARR